MLQMKDLLPKSDKEPPSEYIIGQEFIEDPDKRKINIICVFPISAVINEYNFSSDLFNARVYPIYPNLCLEIERDISKKLRDSIFADNRCYRFFISYIFQALGGMNDYLSEQMYLTGHLLIQTYSVYDIKQIVIVDLKSGVKTEIDWPHVTAAFPPVLSRAGKYDKIFIRDFIDSMNCYIEGNYDECIRKLISSLDNAFSEYKINGKQEPYSETQLKGISELNNRAKTLNLHITIDSGSFIDKLNEFITKGRWRKYWSNFFSIWISNIKFIYRLRNHIIHSKLRLKSEDRVICDKGVATVWYIYQNNVIDPEIRRYLKYLYFEYQMLVHDVDGYNLDDLSGIYSDLKQPDDVTMKPCIDSDEKIDDFVFKSLEIENVMQQQILKKYGIK